MLRFFLIFLTVISLNAQSSSNTSDILAELSEKKISYSYDNIKDVPKDFFQQREVQEYINLFIQLKSASYEDYFQHSKSRVYNEESWLFPKLDMLRDYAELIRDKEPKKMLDISASLLRLAKHSQNNSYGMLNFVLGVAIYEKLLPTLKTVLIDENISKELRSRLQNEIRKYAPTNLAGLNRGLSHEIEWYSHLNMDMGSAGEKIIHEANSVNELEMRLYNRYGDTIQKYIEKDYHCLMDAISNDSIEELKQCEDKMDSFSASYLLTSPYASLIETIIELLHLQEHIKVELYSFENLFAQVASINAIPKIDTLWIKHKDMIREYKKLF